MSIIKAMSLLNGYNDSANGLLIVHEYNGVNIFIIIEVTNN